MKFNLKNRPPNHGYKDVEEWFEGFEDELREMLLESERLRTSHMVIEEILGIE